VDPYARFVRAERDHLTAAQAELETCSGRITSLLARIDTLT
jgi:hypothetical protein